MDDISYSSIDTQIRILQERIDFLTDKLAHDKLFSEAYWYDDFLIRDAQDRMHELLHKVED